MNSKPNTNTYEEEAATISTLPQLQAWALSRNLRDGHRRLPNGQLDPEPSFNWHEPDEKEVDAWVEGEQLDTAHGAAAEAAPGFQNRELRVVLTVGGQPSAVVNLADLLDWATNEGPRP